MDNDLPAFKRWVRVGKEHRMPLGLLEIGVMVSDNKLYYPFVRGCGNRRMKLKKPTGDLVSAKAAALRLAERVLNQMNNELIVASQFYRR